METARFVWAVLRLTWGKLCRQRFLLAGLVLLCLLLPLGAGRAAEALFSRGTAFSGVTLAVTAPEGDGTPRLLAQYMGGMEDVAQYCKILSMDEGQALAALARGEVTAVLCLPENFIRGVMRGDNPDLRLIVPGDRPLEALLLLWVGQSASDILAAFQSGVYAVLELYDHSPPPGLTRDQALIDINLRYITLAVERGGMFQTDTISAAGALPVSLHYALALLAYFGLSAAPLFVPLYSGDWLAFQRRLRSVGRGCLAGYFSAVAVGTAALFLLLAPALLALERGNVPAVLGAALAGAVFCSLFSALCCLATESAAGCGVAAFLVSLLSLALAGGIVPPVLLPRALRELGRLSPVSWLSGLAARSMGCGAEETVWPCLVLSAGGMLVLSLALYRRRADRQEVAL